MNYGSPHQFGPSFAVGVVKVVNGTNPGPASGITYDVSVSMDGGIVTFDAIAPQVRPDSAVDINALPVGTLVLLAGASGLSSSRLVWVAPMEQLDPDADCSA